jgi:hypothetical protein
MEFVAAMLFVIGGDKFTQVGGGFQWRDVDTKSCEVCPVYRKFVVGNKVVW